MAQARLAMHVLAMLLVILAGCRDQRSADAAGSGATAEAECSGATCTKFGREGECIRGVCVLSGGACSRDLDCDDGNVCTNDVCEEGRCVTSALSGGCRRDDGSVGTCDSGVCEWTGSVLCLNAKDCPDAANPCGSSACVDGACVRETAEDGQACTSSIGREGVCRAGICDPGEADANARSCRRRWEPYRGYVQKCTGGLRFRLDDDAVASAEKALEAGIKDEIRYDMKVSLVELPAGGYNIVVHNRRERSDVRGLCDPSFVAFHVASFTSRTNWRSINLHIWLDPYREGWGLSTRGSRSSLQAGKDRSLLGELGVVDVKGFRTWLEKEFYPLTRPGQSAMSAAVE